MKILLCFITLLLAINANAATYFFNRFTTNAETAVGNMTVSGLSVTGATPGVIRMSDADNSNLIAWAVPANIINSYTNLFPVAPGTGFWYVDSVAGVMTWSYVTVGSGLTLSGGVLSGNGQTPIASDINYATFNPTNFTQAQGLNGSAAAPTYSFFNATDRGMYAGTISDRVLHWAIEGAEVMKLDRFGELFTFEAIILHNLVRLDGVGTHLQWTDPNGKGPYLIPSQQAGHTNITAGTSLVISFVTTMQSTNYTAMCVNNGAALTGFFVSNKTPTNFTANFAIITGSDIDWQITEHTQ